MNGIELLSKCVARKTGYTEEEARQKLLVKMDTNSLLYQADINRNAIKPDSWAAITLCFDTSDPEFYIKKLGKKKDK